ncbi:Smg-4/UPF3 family-domain-containing protein [Poronia punctata]|nr:Smg-4/UPF3 family-domain-containing protein [Poronia punctata]
MAKSQADGKRVIIRRLPPGMTEDEFWAILGDEWKPGHGKVDSARYDDGQISFSPSDPSRPARCYLYVIQPAEIPALGDKVQQSKWEDAKHTSTDPALVAPPCLEIAVIQKMPTGKKRTDPRQGTIDSEPEFMKFLEKLTAPQEPKETDPEQVADDASKADAKVTTTPLVEYLKEKRANKAKEAALAKSAKHSRHESQSKGKEDPKKKGKDSKGDKAEKSSEKEKDKVTQPVKLLTKKAVAQDVAEAAKAAASQASSSRPTEDAPTRNRRANISAAAKILQRDLGLSPGSAHRRARQDAAKTEPSTKSDSSVKDSKENATSKATTSTTPTAPSKAASTASPSTPSAPKSQASEGSRRGRGAKATKQNSSTETGKGKANESLTTGKAAPMATPIILKRKDESGSAAVTSPPTLSAASTSTPATPTGPKSAATKAPSGGKQLSANQKKATQANIPSVTTGATRGFVKHANPTQGVTEPLLKRAMETFGPVTFVEIDKRKGFAYVDFGTHEGLVKAIAASPVSVAQGTVQVLERKDTKKTTPAVAAPAQPTAQKKTETQTTTQPPNQGERSKRGGRGRGRKGGANSTNADQAGSSAAQPEIKAGTATTPG